MLRRFIAVLLLFVLVIGLIPTEAFASGDGAGTQTGTGSGSSSSGSSTASGSNLKWTPLTGGTPLTAGQTTTANGKYYYILELSTGTIRDDGAADNVVFFNLHYTTGSDKRSTILMPRIDAVEKGFKIAQQAGNANARRGTVTDMFGITTADLSARQTLQSVHTDQILFESPAEITSIDSLQIFGQRMESQVTWSCQGLRIFRVDKLYGLDMYGWYSDLGYIDFDGEVICDMYMGSNGGNFRWKTNGGMYTIKKAGDKGGLPGCVLVNKAQASSYEGQTFVGTKYTSQAGNRVALSMDFADQADAGFEALAPLYAAGSKPSLKAMEFCEVAALTVRYQDVWGNVREASMPLAANAIGQFADMFSTSSIAGYGQQGDGVAMSLMLPGCEKVVNVSLTIGNAGLQKAGIIQNDATAAPVRQTRRETIASDDIRYLNFKVYDDPTKVKVALDGATVVYDYDEKPSLVSVATSIDGLRIAPEKETYFYLQTYKENMALKPSDKVERYLVSLYTDNVVNAGTVDDIRMQITYTNLAGKKVTSPNFAVRDYINQFYGEWPGNTDQFAYKYGLSQGNKVRFMIPLSSVGTIDGVSFKMEGSDEWQIKGAQFQYVQSYGPRVATYKEIQSKELDPDDPKQRRFLSHIQYDRKVNAHDICFAVGSITGDFAENPDYDIDNDPDANPASDTWVPGDLIQNDGEWKGYNGEGKEVVERDDVDWEKLITEMTLDDTSRDLGFTKKRRVYTVHVKVGNDKVTSINDDCGSANLFYFQLVFENGNSGVVLANQQIDGDAFRTAADVYFEIPTVMDYGELQSILIIPDDQDSNSNIYDKMKISYIEVMQNTNAALIPTWKFEGSDEEGLGWVGIDYRDTGEAGTIKGVPGHSISELATEYTVTSATYSAKLLISITTGTYQRNIGKDVDGNPKYEPAQQMVGGLSFDYHFEDTNGEGRDVEGIDAVHLMNDYSGRPDSHKRTYDNGLTSAEVDYTVSNPMYNFRAGKTDRFFLNVSDITKLTSMTLYTKSDVSTYWTITDVTVHLVNGTGHRYLNAQGEYSYRYDPDEKLTYVTSWSFGDEAMETLVPVYGGPSTDGTNSGVSGIQAIDINFEDNPIKTDRATNSWNPVIAREPKSKNDTLNIFIYPSTAEGSADPTSYELTGGVIYTDSYTLETMLAGAGTLDFSYDKNGQPVFSKVGISASNLSALNGVSIKTASKGSLPAPMSYGIIQQVRSGVLIQTYYLNGIRDADTKSTMSITSSTNLDHGILRVLMQVSPNNPPQDLIALEKDMALAVYFTPAGAPDQELRSKYIYLTDAGYTSIKPGELLEIDFDLGEVSEVKAISAIRTGTLDVDFENCQVALQKSDGTVTMVNSIEGGFTPARSAQRFNMKGSVELVSITFKTAEDSASTTSGTTDPVRLTIGYLDEYDTEQTWFAPDMRPYIQNDKKLLSGGTDTLKVLIPGLKEVRYVKLEPYNADVDLIGAWTLERITTSTGLNGRDVSRSVSKRISEDDPETIFIGDIIMIGALRNTYSYTRPMTKQPELMIKRPGSDTAFKSEQYMIRNDETGTYTVASGSTVYIDSRISGSSQGYTYRFVQVDPATGLETQPDFSVKHYDYKEDKLKELQEIAQTSLNSGDSSEEERALATQVQQYVNIMLNAAPGFRDRTPAEDGGQPDVSGYSGTGKYGFVLDTPINFSDQKLQYRLTVTCVENASLSYTLDIVVDSEEDILKDAAEQLEKLANLAEYTILDATGNEVSTEVMKRTDNKSILLKSGESVRITPKIGEGKNFTATVMNYEPTTQAKGTANFDAKHNYSEGTLTRYETEAQSILTDTTMTDTARDAAQNVLNIIDDLRNGSGSYSVAGQDILLNAPHNYSGTNVNYIITVKTGETSTFDVVVSVEPETDTLATAYTEMKEEKEDAEQQASREAMAAAEESRMQSEEESRRESESLSEAEERAKDEGTSVGN